MTCSELFVLCVAFLNECVATQSPAGPWPFQPRDVSPQQQTRGFRCGTTSRRLGLRTSRRLDVQSPAYVHKPEQREVKPVDIESRDLL